MDNSNKEYIICSAVHFNDGVKREHQPKNIDMGLVVCGRRHHNCYTTASYINIAKRGSIQGFLTNLDNFVDRIEAAKIAYESGQTDKQVLTLISEDIY